MSPHHPSSHSSSLPSAHRKRKVGARQPTRCPESRPPPRSSEGDRTHSGRSYASTAAGTQGTGPEGGSLRPGPGGAPPESPPERLGRSELKQNHARVSSWRNAGPQATVPSKGAKPALDQEERARAAAAAPGLGRLFPERWLPPRGQTRRQAGVSGAGRLAVGRGEGEKGPRAGHTDTPACERDRAGAV